VSTDYLLQEIGDKFVLEDGSGFLLLESSGVVSGGFPWSVALTDAARFGASASDAARGRATISDAARFGATVDDE